MLPGTHYLPTVPLEGLGHDAVAIFVPIQLRTPIVVVGARDISVLGAAMPEASVDKHRQP